MWHRGSVLAKFPPKPVADASGSVDSVVRADSQGGRLDLPLSPSFRAAPAFEDFRCLIGRESAQRLMRPMLVVGLPQHFQCGLQFGLVGYPAHPQRILDGSPDALDPAVHPRAMRFCALVTDVEPVQRESEDPRGEDRLVVGADRLGLSVVVDRIEQEAEDFDAALAPQGLKPKQLAASVIDQSEDRLWSIRVWSPFGQIQCPSQTKRAGIVDVMRMAPRMRLRMPVFLQEFRGMALADMRIAMGMASIEDDGQLPAADVGIFVDDGSECIGDPQWLAFPSDSRHKGCPGSASSPCALHPGFCRMPVSQQDHRE